MKAIAAENIMLRQQFISLNRNRKRSPKLNTIDKIIFAFLPSFVSINRLNKIVIILKPATIFKISPRTDQKKISFIIFQKINK